MELTCATYNILHGYHRDMVLQNVDFLIGHGVDIICLQEVEKRFEPYLRKFLAQQKYVGWQVRVAHVGLGGNVALVWNSGKLRLKRTRVITLPKLRTPSRLQRLRKMTDRIDRAALVGIFESKGLTYQIASAHIAWEGGNNHRMRQIRFLRDALEKEPADIRIVAGDFNTLAPRALGHVHEKRVEHALGAHYMNAHPKLSWSYDISHADPNDGLGFLPRLHKAGMKFRTRLDYIFATNVTKVTSAMHDLPGSDHRPLTATFLPLLAPQDKNGRVRTRGGRAHAR